MKLNQVIVIYKQVSLTPYGKKGGRKSRLKEGHSLHLKTLEELYELLKKLGIPFTSMSSKQLGGYMGADLIITVGGDGTALTTSHYVTKTPIFGIKSFGRQSVGHFCAASDETMENYLIGIIAGKHKPIPLHRMQVILNGHPIRELALNDVLFAHALPAGMSRYSLKIGKVTEEHKSSGIWISSAAGSTAAIRAAGGKALPLKSDKFEYLVREPYMPEKKYLLINDVLKPNARVEILSRTSHGTICIDGPTIQYPAPTDTRIVVRAADHPCWIFWKK